MLLPAIPLGNLLDCEIVFPPTHVDSGLSADKCGEGQLTSIDAKERKRSPERVNT